MCQPKLCLLPLAILFSALVGSASPARAAAYYVGEVGARSIARGGANMVNPGDPSAVWLNPAAITHSTGVQLQLDFDLVWLSAKFIRDCGGVPQGCAPLESVSRNYGEGRDFNVTGGSRHPPDDDNAPAEPGSGGLGLLDDPSRFDGTTTAVQNQAAVQPIPRLWATLNLDSFGLDGVAVGAFVFAPASGDYSYPDSGFTRYTLIDRDMLEVYYGFTAAYRFSHWISVGGSIQGVTAGVNQNVRLSGDVHGNEDPNYDIQIRVNALQHMIPSGNFGVWSNPLKDLGIDLEIAGSVQLPRFVRATGPLTIEQFGPSFQREFLEGDPPLAAINSDGATAQAEFTLPAFWRGGLKYTNDNLLSDNKKTVGFDIEADFVYEQWSMYDHIHLTTNNLTFATLGGAPEELPAIVQPKDWNDAWSIRVGGTIALWNRMLEVHGGSFYETTALPNETYSMELVDSDKIGLGTGVSATLWGMRLDVAYSHIFYFDRQIGQESIVYAGGVDNPLDGGFETRTRVAMGKYTAGVDSLNFGLTVAFDDMFNFGVHAPRPTATHAPASAPSFDPPADPTPAQQVPDAAPSPTTTAASDAPQTG